MFKRFALANLLAVAVGAAVPGLAQAHCQIPCGIYDDAVRFKLMLEHVTTIEKSMNQIRELSASPQPNWNQLVRWVDNKEKHADELVHIATYYFLTQRIKPANPADKAAMSKYLKHLALIHQIVVNAMKTKQTTDLEYCTKLRKLITEFKESYMGNKTAHLREHHHDCCDHEKDREKPAG